MKEILIGTNNPSKLSTMRAYFEPLGVRCVSPRDLALHVSASEDAVSAAENALQKAFAFHRASGMPVVAEDSALIFLDLPQDHPDQPGVRVRRPAGHAPLTNDEDMMAYYMEIIHRHGGRLRAAWQDAWCIMADEGHYALHEDDRCSLERHAMILVDTPCKERMSGWPLDSLTLSADGRYWASMSSDEKKAVKSSYMLLAEDRRLFQQWLKEQIELLL